MQIQKTRNYIGLIGGLLALLGFFCPFAASKSSWAFVNYVVEHDFGEYFVSCRTFSEKSAIFFAVYLFFIAAAGIAFVFAYHKTGLCLTVLPTIFFLIIFLQEGPELVSSSNIGFWLSVFGLILMLLANNLLSLNKTLFPNSVFYCNQPQEFDSGINKICTAGVCKVNINGTRGYTGIVGAAMTLIGFFLPYLKWGFISVSFYDYFISDEMSPVLAFAYIALLFGIGAAYAFSRHALGFVLSLPYAAYFLYILFDLISGVDVVGTLQIGFWVTIIGVILMVISPFVTKKLGK